MINVTQQTTQNLNPANFGTYETIPYPIGVQVKTASVISDVLYVRYVPLESLIVGNTKLSSYFLRVNMTSQALVLPQTVANPSFWKNSFANALAVATVPGDTAPSFFFTAPITSITGFANFPAIGSLVNINFFVCSTFFDATGSDLRNVVSGIQTLAWTTDLV